MRTLFLLAAGAIAVIYYIGVSRDINALNDGFAKSIESMMYAATGRNSTGEFYPYPSGYRPTTVEEEIDPDMYYLPPGVPKEEPYTEI